MFVPNTIKTIQLALLFDTGEAKASAIAPV
jgi:hypothetical protein